ncbi:FAD-dependent oxidoreductase [Heliophilum fasciatum]|uniref:Pyridine nucleotide-disulfide oxidoreductase n=1 Tax=Heliophilum fasciatum TaxID=35700 RepID=A0A4R2RFA9_9FIRM|nr:FAD-dependent oxidoreductase [Heliophilum fasciatum]MCW2279190.1 nitrite reductase (NADH) large subunit [Heliophilum fasciatum]TCP60979.1 pyridine nucleotide-disulfide oxidoreductase [Heliophilum fasciatum]
MNNVKTSWRCVICGYIHIGETAPATCVICGASSNDFEVAVEPAAPPAESHQNWRCIICGYLHEGGQPPTNCPICGVGENEFEPHRLTSSTQSTTKITKVVIIGGGVAGLTAAETIRNHSDSMMVTLVSAEQQTPYYRLNLTRYLAGEIDSASLAVHPDDWYATKRIDLRSGQKVINIDRQAQQVFLDDQSVLDYDHLILTMGAHPFVPPIPGSNLAQVFTVRTMDDAEQILKIIPTVESCVCIGGGILGLETAGAIAKHGIKVQVIEGSDWLMPRQLNRQAGQIVKEHLRKLGIEVIENGRTQAITGQEQCDGVQLENGVFLPTQLVIIATGVRPNTHLARKCGLNVDKGLLVDSTMRTSDERIYAAGDITEHHGTLYGLWNAAQYQGKIAGLNVVGERTEFGGIPRSNVLKVLGLDLFSIGQITPLDGSYSSFEKVDGDRYYSLTLRDGRIVGSIVIGDQPSAMKIKQAIEQGHLFPVALFNHIDQFLQQLAR